MDEKKEGVKKEVAADQTVVDLAMKKAQLAEEGSMKDMAQIMEKCGTAKGYMIYAAIMSPEVDADGNRKIEYKYMRYKFPFEDAYRGVKNLKEHLLRDLDERK